MLCCESFAFAAGTKLHFLNLLYLIYGFAYSIPIAAILSSLMVIFYTIKHDSNKWMNLGIYILICALIYGLILPASFKLVDVLDQKHENDEKKTQFLTLEYFRPINNGKDGICYIRNINHNGKIDGLILKDGKITNFYGKTASELFAPNEQFSSEQSSNEQPVASKLSVIISPKISINDPLLENSIKPKGVIQVLITLFQTMLEIGAYSYRGKGLFLIAFLSMAVALQSVYGYAKTSKWRLCNGSWVLGTFIIVCICNLAIYIAPVTDTIVASAMEKNLSILSDRSYLQIILNSVFFAINLTVGIVKACKNPNANKKDGEE